MFRFSWKEHEGLLFSVLVYICEMSKHESKREDFKKKQDASLLCFLLYKLLLIPHLKTKRLSYLPLA